MAYINVAEWNTEQVTDWLKGTFLDNSMYHYVQSFTNNQVGGQELLNIRPYELEQLGIYTIGHQEIVLEAVEQLRNFHYHLDKENLQFLALHVATAATSLYRQLKNSDDRKELETHVLNDITRTLVHLKPLVSWLDRSPFQGHAQFVETRDNIMKFGLELATVAQRDRFVENPVEQIRGTAEKLAKLANYIIQDITDPMVLQPASLELVTVKKRECNLGFEIIPGVLRITNIKFNSPAHNSGKIEEGDELVQINYQTVVGWQYIKVIKLLQEYSTDVLLTLKKRPKHTKIYGQIYMKPYRLPSKKRATPNKWGDSLPSPRPTEIFSIQDFPMPLGHISEKQIASDSESINSDILTPTTPKETDPKEMRLYMPKPRTVLQRRNTICGDQLICFKNLENVMYWPERRNELQDEESPSLRDKSISFGFGLDVSQRPTTCLGITNGGVSNGLGMTKGSLPEMKVEQNQVGATIAEKDVNNTNGGMETLTTGVSKVVRFESNMKFEKCHVDTKYTCNVDNTVLETLEPIPYVDEEVPSSPPKATMMMMMTIPVQQHSLPDVIPKAIRMTKETGLVEALNSVVINRELQRRGKLDKSHSTPAYDRDNSDDDDIPPAIEPRAEFLNKIPPAPPPRPKRTIESSLGAAAAGGFVNCPQSNKLNDSNIANVVDLKNPENCQNIIESVSAQKVVERSATPTDGIARYTPPLKKLPPTKHFLEEKFEALELLTPNKTKSLTLKKKTSMLAKRRKITLKALGTSDIQGHLYRRSKDKNGVTYWAKLYFVLMDSALYGFKSKDSPKANCLIFLSGFTVSLATEVHSRPFAFKVYHPRKTFYFAAETQEALSQWMEYIRQATLKGNTNSLKASSDQNIKELFTETESSDDEFMDASSSFNIRAMQEPSAAPAPPAKAEKSSYHLNFGSLKKFTKSNLPSFPSLNKSSNEKKLHSSDVPVPTDQFRSYRKVPGNAGLQLGTNSIDMTSSLTKVIVPEIDIAPPPPTPTQLNQSPPQQSVIFAPPISTQSLTPPQPQPILQPSTPLQLVHAPSTRKVSISSVCEKENNSLYDDERDEFPLNYFNKTRKSRNILSHNYIHASNPNLVEFDFQTSKSLDHSLPKIMPSNTWDAHNHNLQGVTLKDLMLQKQAEEAVEMYNNRVYLGVEKQDEHNGGGKQLNKSASITSSTSTIISASSKSTKNNSHSKDINLIITENQPVINKIQSRSLPKTPDYAQSFKPDDKDIIMARSKEGQKLRDFGYEFISGDDQDNARVNQTEAWLLKRHDKISPAGYNTNILKKKSLNWMNSGAAADDNKFDKLSSSSRQGSLKKIKISGPKNKLDQFKVSSEKLFQFKNHSNDKNALQPMTLPLNKVKHSSSGAGSVSLGGIFSNNLHQHDGLVGGGGGYDGTHRKNSVPEKSTGYLSKFSFSSSKTPKERRLLGSPRLHRALFGRTISQNDGNFGANSDREIFSQVNFNKPGNHSPEIVNMSTSMPTPVKPSAASTSTHTGSPDYPNLEYPPVFEPEIYSLSDPTTSLTLLRRRNNNLSK